MSGRATDEWIGKTPDSKVPPRVRARIFMRDNGRCHLTGRQIAAGEPWELEHKLALALGGEHRETNLAPALVEPHKVKTASDVKAKAKADRCAKKHLGIRPPSQFPNARSGRFKTPLGKRTVIRSTGEPA